MRAHTRDAWMGVMSADGLFSANLKSLNLQLKTLLEDCGGDNVQRLLDMLCRLNASEQEIVLKIFSNTLERLASGKIRLETCADRDRKEFEEELFGDIAKSIQLAIALPLESKLEVIDGGKSGARKMAHAVLDLEKLRNERKLRSKYLHN